MTAIPLDSCMARGSRVSVKALASPNHCNVDLLDLNMSYGGPVSNALPAQAPRLCASSQSTVHAYGACILTQPPEEETAICSYKGQGPGTEPEPAVCIL